MIQKKSDPRSSPYVWNNFLSQVSGFSYSGCIMGNFLMHFISFFNFFTSCNNFAVMVERIEEGVGKVHDSGTVLRCSGQLIDWFSKCMQYILLSTLDLDRSSTSGQRLGQSGCHTVQGGVLLWRQLCGHNLKHGSSQNRYTRSLLSSHVSALW